MRKCFAKLSLSGCKALLNASKGELFNILEKCVSKNWLESNFLGTGWGTETIWFGKRFEIIWFTKISEILCFGEILWNNLVWKILEITLFGKILEIIWFGKY